MKITVIGAGVVGCSVALSLVDRDHEVTLIDPNGVASGASGTTYAWINSHKKHPEAYHAINARGVDHWRTVVAPRYLGAVYFNGHVEIANDSEHRLTLERRLTRLQSLGYDGSWITDQMARGLVPVELPAGADIALFPSEGHAYPAVLGQTIYGELQTSPRFTFLAVAAAEISADGHATSLQSGDTIASDAVVLCAGNHIPQLARTAGVELPFVQAETEGGVFGYIGYAEARDHGLERLVTTDHISIRPDGPNALIFQTLDLDRSAMPGVPVAKEIEEEMQSRLKRQLSDQELRVSEVKVGERVIPADGLTVAGRLQGENQRDSALWVIGTHSGVVLGPWLGETIAREISGCPEEPLLSPFRPDRFEKYQESLPQYAAPTRPGDQ